MAKSDKYAKNRRRNVYTADLRLATFGGRSARRHFSGEFSAVKFSAANSAIGGGWGSSSDPGPVVDISPDVFPLLSYTIFRFSQSFPP